MRAAAFSMTILLLAAAGPEVGRTAELRPETLKAWDAYIHDVDSNQQSRLEAGAAFLWADEAPGRSDRLRGGEILVVPVAARGALSVPNGLIHDWMGAMFIPHATLESVLAITRDYDHYKEYYKPVVTDSRALEGPGQIFSMRWLHHVLFVTAAIEGEYEAHDFELDERRCYNVADSTRVQEIESYGRKDERLLPPDQGNGFIWRLHSIARYEERDGGVYVELEAIGLTRDVPGSLRWLVNPVVTRLSRDSVRTSLRQTREAVTAHTPAIAARVP
jgi:hypothetical protein